MISFLAFLMVIMASGIARGCVRLMTTTRASVNQKTNKNNDSNKYKNNKNKNRNKNKSNDKNKNKSNDNDNNSNNNNLKDKNVRWLKKKLLKTKMSFRLSVFSLRRIKMKCERTKYMQAYKATPVVV